MGEPRADGAVVVDSHVNFGQASVWPRMITVAVLSERFRAGESIELLAHDYDMTAHAVESALRWALMGSRARARAVEHAAVEPVERHGSSAPMGGS